MITATSGCLEFGRIRRDGFAIMFLGGHKIGSIGIMNHGLNGSGHGGGRQDNGRCLIGLIILFQINAASGASLLIQERIQ